MDAKAGSIRTNTWNQESSKNESSPSPGLSPSRISFECIPQTLIQLRLRPLYLDHTPVTSVVSSLTASSFFSTPITTESFLNNSFIEIYFNTLQFTFLEDTIQWLLAFHGYVQPSSL